MTNQSKWKQAYDLSRIVAPIPIIHSSDDQVIPYAHAENAFKHIHNTELLKLPDGGHLKLGHGQLIKTTTSEFINQMKS